MADQKYLEYLSAEDAKLYAMVSGSDDEKDKIIKRLLERLAASSRSAHVNSRY